MTSRVSIASQISAVWRAAGRLNGTSPPPQTEGQIALETTHLTAAATSLEWLEANREWIADAAAARKGTTDED